MLLKVFEIFMRTAKQEHNGVVCRQAAELSEFTQASLSAISCAFLVQFPDRPLTSLTFYCLMCLSTSEAIDFDRFH